MNSRLLKRVILAGVVLSAIAAHAADVTYTGPNGGAWSDNANWDTGVAPAGNDIAQINSGDTVSLDHEWLVNPLVVNVDGTITQTGAMRSWDVKVNVSSTGVLNAGGNWLVLWGGGAEFNFDSGATLIQSSGRIQFANNADMTLGFNLASDGFQTLSANLLQFDGYAGQTIKVDMVNYTGDTGVIVLMDLNGNNGMTDAIFQGLNLVVENAGNYTANLQWNEVTSAIELNITDLRRLDLMLYHTP